MLQCSMIKLIAPRSMRMMKKMIYEAPFQTLAEAVIMADDLNKSQASVVRASPLLDTE